MKDGFVPVAAITPKARVADVAFNVEACAQAVRRAAADGAAVIVLPELSITAYTCEDLFGQAALLDAAEAGLAQLAELTADIDALVFAGVPARVAGKLYNCAAALSRGRILGLVPKRHIPAYGEFYEGRHFAAGPARVSRIAFAGARDVPFGACQLFCCEELPSLVVAAEICEDLWVAEPPSIAHAQAGATLIVNLSASDETVGKDAYRRSLVAGQSARLVCGYAYCDAGCGESTTDLVFAGHDLICENGRVLAQARPFGPGYALSEVDMGFIASERQRLTTYRVAPSPEDAGYVMTPFSLAPRKVALTRFVDPHPFVPDDPATRAERCEEILSIQAHGLARRLAHTRSAHAVIGLSGGLDSTLALLVCARAFDLLGMPRAGVIAVTMPGFGTTSRTHGNARELAEALGVTLREIDITRAVRQHLADIGHDEDARDVTYENAQARERTQILMDIANQEGGLVIGTGDLSELALGWATYNGDHMSMYAVNASVPKTLVRHLVRHAADTSEDAHEAEVLLDVLATPVSPELLPADSQGAIAQKTEELVGPYELHDFFIYQVLRCGFAPRKVWRLACHAFAGAYDPATILRWLRFFYQRLFANQFKRSCLPDGPKVGSVAVSPRGDLRMPSDAVAGVWMRELEGLEGPSPEGLAAQG